MPPIDIWLLTGHLGSGKTALLQRMLAMPRFAATETALVLNEFGTLGVDASRLAGQGAALFEINKGSVFCICTKTDFLKVLDELAHTVRPRQAIVEATGVAHGSDIEALLAEPHLRGLFRLRASVCVVDAGHFTRVAAFLTAAVDQVRTADGIVINKADKTTYAGLHQLQRVLGGLNARAPQTVTTHGRVGMEFLEGLVHEPASKGQAEAPPPEIRATTLRTDAGVDRARFAAAVEALGERLLRLKGHVRFADGLRRVEAVGTDWTETAPDAAAPETTAFTVITFQTLPVEVRDRFGQAWE